MDTDKFQELVLQQLENLNLRIGSIEKGQQTLEKGQQTLEKGQQSLEKGQQALEKGQQSLEKGQQALENGQQSLEKGQQALEKGQQSLQQDIEKIRQSQVRMEFEHGEKLSALFDGYKSLSETMTDHTERLQRIEEKITTHDVQIRILDKTKSNKRKVKS